MSILIKDMEMPESCLECRFSRITTGIGNSVSYCLVDSGVHISKKKNDCPLLQIVTEDPIVFRNGEIVKDGN